MKDGYLEQGYYEDPETGYHCMYIQADELESSDEIPSHDGLTHRVLFVDVVQVEGSEDRGGVVQACINKSGEFYDFECYADETMAILVTP